MWPKCGSCSTHHDPADEARCRNARDLGLKLNARLNVRAVPAACERPMHLRFMASWDAFMLNTQKWQELDDGKRVYCLAECRRCGEPLKYEVRNSDARLAAAVEEMERT